MNHEIPQPVLDVLKSRFDILLHLSFLDFDHDFDVLRSQLEHMHRSHYDAHEKILIEHLDTDFYFEHCRVGLHLRNFFGITQQFNISPSVFVFYTNHIGIQQEIDMLCCQNHPTDRPLIIESFLSRLHHRADLIHEIDPRIHLIRFNALCTMNLTRSHRHAVWHALKHIDPQTLLLCGTLN